MFNWLTSETKSLYIARPDHSAADLVYLHPDRSIPRGAKLTVRSSECALFFREGRFIGRLDAGTVQLDTANIPFLGHAIINPLTDGNHFICELFFVSLNETIIGIADTDLGQYRDLNSANVVTVSGQFAYTVRVSDPLKLIVELAGQNAAAGSSIMDVLGGRLLNQLRRVVGGRMRARPALDVVSNVDAEAISEELRTIAQPEFNALGIGVGRVFDLALSLDASSLAELRAFGREESKLALQSKGAQIATQDGFTQFNLVQGQRAAMEGLGQGLGTGQSPMIFSGFGSGSPFNTVTAPTPAPRAAPSRSGPGMISGPAQFLLCGATGETGPYSARQVALVAISKGQPLSALTLRRSDDPPDMTFSADLEPQVVAEYQRRAGGVAVNVPAGASASVSSPPQNSAPAVPSQEATFELAVRSAGTDGVLREAEVMMLARLAVALGACTSEVDGKMLTVTTAVRLGLRLGA
ncbi:MAG: SPFH domain-containing protein [Betaproteobacteria bacterium]